MEPMNYGYRIGRDYEHGTFRIVPYADTYIRSGLAEEAWQISDEQIPTQYEELQELQDFLTMERARLHDQHRQQQTDRLDDAGPGQRLSFFSLANEKKQNGETHADSITHTLQMVWETYQDTAAP